MSSSWGFTHEFKNAEIRDVQFVNETFMRAGRVINWPHFMLMIEEEKTANRVYLIDNDTSDISKYQKGMVGNFIIKVEFRDTENNKLMGKIRVLSFKPRRR